MHAMYVYIAQWTELHEEIRKSQQPIDLNTLMQNHKNDLKKPYTKIYEKCSLQLLYDEKIHQKSSLHQLTKNKMRFGHVSRALKSVVLGKNGLGQFDIPCPSSCQVPKWWDIRVLGLVRLILKLLKKQETRNKHLYVHSAL